MAESGRFRGLSVQALEVPESPRHSFFVRITHSIYTLSFFGLVLSGLAIILAHPRLYWGETGGVGVPSLIDLPVPLVRDIPIRGPGRYLHFLSAWVCVITGVIYVLAGVFTRHFRLNLVPDRAQFAWSSISHVVRNHLRFQRPIEKDAESYNVLQRLAYLAVVFVFLPLMIWTGLAMSPAIVSVFPFVVTVFGGQQSARTVHFSVAVFLLVFVLVHLVMVGLAGFKVRTRAMIVGS
jgi:thiosulfate reductase cytochrome b subunit